MQNKQVKNVVFGFLSWFFPIILSFVSMPIIIGGLGEHSYGIYALVLGFISYSFNFNIGRAITKYVAEYRPKGETQKVKEIVSATLFINLIVGIIAILVICLPAKFFTSTVLKIDENSQTETINALYLAAFIIFFTMLSQVFNAVIQGIQRFDIYSKLTNLNSILLIAGNIILVLNGFDVFSMLVWNLFAVIFIGILYFILAKKLVPEVGFRFSFSRDTLAIVAKYSSGIIAYQILGNLILLFERSWVTRELGTEKLAYYIVPMTLTFYIHGFISSITLMIFPLASELKDNPEKLQNLYQKASKISCLIITFFCVTGVVGSRIFLTNYLGEKFANESALVMSIHFVTFSFLALLVVSWQLSEGLGFPKYNAWQSFVWLIITVTLITLLTPIYDIVGVAIARVIGVSVITCSILLVEKKFFGKTLWQFWLKLIGLLFFCGTITATVEHLIFTNFDSNWFVFIFGCSVGFVVYILTLFIFGLISKEEKLLFRKFYAR